MNKKQILFVCTGNTCRSPMAEGLFRHLAPEGLAYEAASCGLFTTDGAPASDYAQAAARELGADLSQHRTAMLTRDAAQGCRYLICMTAAHRDRILARWPDMEEKTVTLLPQDVSDPFGGSLAEYQACARQIEEGVRHLIDFLQQEQP